MQPSWTERRDTSGHGLLPDLGFGGTLVAIFVCSFFASILADYIFVIIAFGPHAFWDDGLRVVNWKHGILSNGEKIGGPKVLLRGILLMLVWGAFIAGSECSAGMVKSYLERRPFWMTSALRLVGGSLLVLFAGWYKTRYGSPIHPIPLSAFIGGSVLIWKSVTGFLHPESGKNETRVASSGIPNPKDL